MMIKTLLSLATLATLGGLAHAQMIEFNFNSNPPDNATSTGTLTPNVGIASAALVGGTTGSFASGSANGGSSDPAPAADNSGWGTTTYAAQNTGSATAGVQFNTSTAQGGGYNNIVIEMDIRSSNTSSRWMQFQYTTDGTNYVTTGLANSGNFELVGGDTWIKNITFNLSSITAVNNNANFGFRVLAVFAPTTNAYTASGSTYAATGTKRFDMVQVYGQPVPEPTTMAALGLGVAALARRRRKK